MPFAFIRVNMSLYLHVLQSPRVSSLYPTCSDLGLCFQENFVHLEHAVLVFLHHSPSLCKVLRGLIGVDPLSSFMTVAPKSFEFMTV